MNLSECVVHSYHTNHQLVKLYVKDILQLPITNWKNNRPADMSRCAEMAKQIYSKRTTLDWMLYWSASALGSAYKAIDGWHRYNTLVLIDAEIKKAANANDLLTPCIFSGDNSWFYSMQILVSVRYGLTYGEEVDWFHQINNSNPVPELYMQDNTKDKLEAVQNLQKKWLMQYKSHFAPTQRPNIPNTNRDLFVDFLGKIYDVFQSADAMETWLQEQNTRLQYNMPKKVSENAKTKCLETGCYLFLEKLDVLLNRI